jgi:hypothetical protein
MPFSGCLLADAPHLADVPAMKSMNQSDARDTAS